MKNRLLQIGLVLALVAAALVLGRRDALPPTPEEAVNALFDAAARGDDAAYLRLVDDSLRASLEETRAQMGAEKFRQTLVQSTRGIKGLAITAADAAGDQTGLDVEIVFADRVERQRMLLTPKRGGWVIASISTAEQEQPEIPYGTPVFERPAEEPSPAAKASPELP